MDFKMGAKYMAYISMLQGMIGDGKPFNVTTGFQSYNRRVMMGNPNSSEVKMPPK